MRRFSISARVREAVLRFIENEGHRVEIDASDENAGESSIRLRVRGHVVTVGISERDPRYFSVSIAYALPEWAHDIPQSAPLLLDLQASFKAVKFFYGRGGSTLVSAIEQFSSTPDEFTAHFWRIVGIVRDAGLAAVERILDRSESKAAAEKFINDFMRGQP